MKISITVFLIVISVYYLLKSIEHLIPLVYRFKYFLSQMNVQSSEESVKDDVETGFYDVVSYRKRMEWLKASRDEEGIYTFQEETDNGDYTGVEVNED